MRAALAELGYFFATMLRSCVFAGAFFAVLLVSHIVTIPGLARYDSILAACLAIQIVLVTARIETVDELKVLGVFHALGVGLELFKTDPRVGSWAYPEAARFAVAGVPLYSGFMYAAVASFICQAWRRFAVELHDYPPPWASLALALAIYANFFTHHFIVDLRWPLSVAVFLLFRHTAVSFVTRPGTRRRLPLVVWFVLVGACIWVAENAATAGGAWAYPDQRLGWRAVSFGKLHSWALLVILSFVLVADLKWLRARRDAARTGAPARVRES